MEFTYMLDAEFSEVNRIKTIYTESFVGLFYNS